MKKLLLAACVMTLAASVFAQGTVIFNNRVVGTIVTHVYAPNSANPGLSQIGNGSTDTPAGAANWTGWTLIGAGGTSGQYGGSTTLAALLAAPGANQAESSLQAAAPVNTFRTGAAGGFLAGGVTAALTGVPGDTSVATVEMFAWDNSSGQYGTAAAGLTAWKAGLIAGGVSGTFNLNAIGGTLNPAPALVGLQSFNLYFVPEPSTMALAGLGAAALLIFRRRK